MGKFWTTGMDLRVLSARKTTVTSNTPSVHVLYINQQYENSSRKHLFSYVHSNHQNSTASSNKAG